MVKERDARQTSSAQNLLLPTRASEQQPPLQNTIPSGPPAVPAVPQQAKFGEASPLRNPLKATSVFNTNQRRPEHHRPRVASNNNQPSPPGQSTQNPPYKPPTLNSLQPAPQPSTAPATRNGFYLPGQKRQAVPQPNANAMIQPDFFEISKPMNPTFRTVQPAPKPMFSSLGPKTTFQPFVPPRTTIDLTKDSGSFDPDAALRDDRFGAADPYTYIDPSKAGENIKALLEGAFDGDDEDKPKVRLRNRAKKTTKVSEKKGKSLADKLADLDVKDENSAHKEATSRAENRADEDEEEEEEDGTVDGLAVKLLPHQVEGVAWMIEKELGERKKNGVLPKGGILADDMGLGKTVQSVTLILTNPRPGLDEVPPEGSKRKLPGKDVGKGTLVVAPLALIKQWEAEIKSKVEPSHALRVLVHHGPSRTKSHLELKKYDVVITTYQVLASEHAGSSDHAEGIKIGCYGIHWYRVILDEAHSIKNRNAKSTQACYSLRSWYRWCLTGTPMQNNLDELQSLIRFLQIKPYDELSHWKAHITGPMKNGKGHYAIKRVQYFLKAFMKRRTKDILKEEGALNFGGKPKDGEQKSGGMKIVERKVETVVCKLNEGERVFYDKLAERANDRLQTMMAGERTDYIGALVLLLRLRQACNDPQLIESAMKKDTDALATAGIGGNQSPRKGASTVNEDVDDLAAMMGGLGVTSKNCDVCQAELEPHEVSDGAVRCAECEKTLATQKHSRDTKKHSKRHRTKRESKVEAAKPANRMRNRKIITDSDDEDEEGGGEWLVGESQQTSSRRSQAGGTDDEDAEGGGRDLGIEDSDTDSDDSDDDMRVRSKRSTTDPTSTDEDSDDSSAGSDSDVSTSFLSSTSSNNLHPSTKIRQLLRILRADSPTHKTIVFSQFTSMLDLIEPHLRAARLHYVRYDGSMRNEHREASLSSLRNDPSCRVLLCSLKCGSLGLNLTAASRVVIVEPFWNPFVEEQAIDRVHRLNQTVDVRVYKLTVADTVEERILALQEKKRELAKAAIEGGKAVAKLSVRDIVGLFGADPERFFGGDKGPPVVAGIEKGGILRPVPGTGGGVRAGDRQGQSSGAGERGTVAVSNQADRRKMMERRDRPRMSNEDPVYGRR